MVRIRLRRHGTNSRPFYRIVVANQQAARDGAFIELVGTYDPIPNPPLINIDSDKVQKWLKNGAQPSESVAMLLKKQGILK
ncbi:MAG: 30S ribosomal protein S16 [Dehalococcoidia bacterium]|nr:30S ribosomal protein S16 [Dehalococcoidia bacterium]MSQ34873.1 30S ribosomal protein S16 [Dehalococcoidia bacterium]